MQTASLAIEVTEILHSTSGAVKAALLALVGAALGGLLTRGGAVTGAKVQAKGTMAGAETQARAQYATAIAQQNHEARRAAYLRLFETADDMLGKIERFQHLASREVAADEPQDPFSASRTEVERATSVIRFYGPPEVQERAHRLSLAATNTTWFVKRQSEVLYGCRALHLARQEQGTENGAVGQAALSALLRVYNAGRRGERHQERECAAAQGPMEAAENAGLISASQRQALLIDPFEHWTRPDQQLREPLEDIRARLTAFQTAAAAELNNTTLPQTQTQT